MNQFEVTEVRKDGPKYGSTDTSVRTVQDRVKISQFGLPITQWKVSDILFDPGRAFARPTASLDFKVILVEKCVLK